MMAPPPSRISAWLTFPPGSVYRSFSISRNPKARVSPTAMSRHLRVLRATGLVEADGVETDARIRMYRLRPDPFVALQAWLDQVGAFWAEQLGSFKAHAERGRGPKRS